VLGFLTEIIQKVGNAEIEQRLLDTVVAELGTTRRGA
jgi:hypothetical protein